MEANKITLSVKCIIFLGVFLPVSSVCSQDWAKPVIKYQQRVDLRDLGYPMVNEIPVNSSAITSLITARNGIIYGGTSGEDAYFFLFELRIIQIELAGFCS